MIIISFDIGLKTCSVAIEQYEECKAVAPKIKYLKGGEATAEFHSYTQEVGKTGKILHLEKRELGDKKAYFSGKAFSNLYAWCKELDEWIKQADVVLIEQQMKINNIAIALMYHLQAFLLISYDAKIPVKLYPSKNKTRVLGAPLKVQDEGTGKLKKVTKYERKKWSAQQAELMLKQRPDHQEWYSYIFLTNKSKKDDLSDVLMQSLSYIITQNTN
jgi:hypothetical protein